MASRPMILMLEGAAAPTGSPCPVLESPGALREETAAAVALPAAVARARRPPFGVSSRRVPEEPGSLLLLPLEAREAARGKRSEIHELQLWRIRSE